MAERLDIDRMLDGWPYAPGDVSVRLVKARGGRDVLQMRVDMGILQLEVENRPDGERPHGAQTYLDYLLGLSLRDGDEMVLTEEQCEQCDREMMQFYHRRICWLALRKYDRAVEDADHNLNLMDFVKTRTPNDEWVLSHEQYRPFILFQRTQASSLAALDANKPEAAIEAINTGLDRIREFFEEHDALERYEDDEFVERLVELRETLRDEYQVGRTLSEQLRDAVDNEQFELAAKLRDQLARRSAKRA